MSVGCPLISLMCEDVHWMLRSPSISIHCPWFVKSQVSRVRRHVAPCGGLFRRSPVPKGRWRAQILQVLKLESWMLASWACILKACRMQTQVWELGLYQSHCQIGGVGGIRDWVIKRVFSHSECSDFYRPLCVGNPHTPQVPNSSHLPAMYPR